MGTAAFTHVFEPGECRFVDGASSACLHTIAQTNPSYARIVDLLKRGRRARITVEDAGVMKMDHSVSPIGFTKSCDN